MVTSRRQKNGLTLVELLVVIVIMLILVAVVLPLAQPTPSQRLAREAARSINVFLATAQTRSMNESREYGVLLVPDDSGERCFELALVKVPPIYAGDNLGAAATISSTLPEAILSDALRIVTSRNNDPVGKRFVEDGDWIRFNYRGAWYFITAVDIDMPSGNPVVTYSVPGEVPAPPTGAVLPFQIRRKPRSSAAGRLTLPTGAYIDLGVPPYDSPPYAVSGLGFLGPLDASRTIMFNTSGQLKSEDPVFLLIGASKPSIGTGTVVQWKNPVRNLLPELPGLWVTVNTNGRIGTTDNAAQIVVDDSSSSVAIRDTSGNVETFDLNNSAQRDEAWEAAIVSSRYSALSGPSLGGR